MHGGAFAVVSEGSAEERWGTWGLGAYAYHSRRSILVAVLALSFGLGRLNVGGICLGC